MNDAQAKLSAAFGHDLCDTSPGPETHTAYGGMVGPPPLAVMRPRSLDDVAAIVRYCIAQGLSMVPQGGLTGLAGGALPNPGPGRADIVISLSAMNAVRGIDRQSRTATVDAGCTVEALDAAAAAEGLCFPFRIGSGGTAQIGGILATRAGGIRSWRHGTAGDLAIGIEAVLADGRIWSQLRRVTKGNTGIDVGGVLIGSEGTLGIITGAVMKLARRPGAHQTALLAVADDAGIAALLESLDRSGGLEVCEQISRAGLEYLTAAGSPPLPLTVRRYVLAEWAGEDNVALRHAVEGRLASVLNSGLLTDGVLAGSERERGDLWRLREGHGTACRKAGTPFQHDIAVPPSAIDEFLAEATALAAEYAPECVPVPICHVGDGNVHFDLLVPFDPPSGLDERLAELRRRIHDLAIDLDGVFSAEHGIGTARVDEFERLTPADSLAAMVAVKRAIDPSNLMNPGKVLADPASARA